MQCKFFSVPLDPQQALEREKKLNDFLRATDVKRVFASLADQPQGPMWSVLFLYDEAGQLTPKTVAAPTASAGALPDPSPDSGPPLSSEQVKLVMALKKWRADQAATEGVPLYMVAHNKWLEDIVRMPVKAMDDLTKVRGLGEWRIQKYGAKIVETLNSASAAKRQWSAPSPAGRA